MSYRYLYSTLYLPYILPFLYIYMFQCSNKRYIEETRGVKAEQRRNKYGTLFLTVEFRWNFFLGNFSGVLEAKELRLQRGNTTPRRSGAAGIPGVGEGWGQTGPPKNAGVPRTERNLPVLPSQALPEYLTTPESVLGHASRVSNYRYKLTQP